MLKINSCLYNQEKYDATLHDVNVPFDGWILALRDTKAKTIINKKLDRVSQGNLGNYRVLNEELCELKIDFGLGYKIYFRQVGDTIILLLCCGDKSTQDRDILRAMEYWQDYRS